MMLTLISPAKKLLSNHSTYIKSTSEPGFKKETEILVRLMKKKSAEEIAALMKLSNDLAQLNFSRFQEFVLNDVDSPNAHPAVFLFQGDVYQGLQAATWSQDTLDFAQSHLGILSGLYGVLKPLDKIQPYRLEMGVRLKNPCGSTLYDFWKKTITSSLNKQLAEQANPVLVNLASTEYFKAVDPKTLEHPAVTVNFYEEKDKVLKMIGIHAKKARGAMAKFIMEHQIDSLDELIKFKDLGYEYNKKSSSERHIDFIKVH